MKGFYVLPRIPYSYKSLEPYISEKLLKIHHQKHHQGYVDNSNKLLEELDNARKNNKKIDSKAVLKALSYNIGGHILHSLFWNNLADPKHGGGGKPSGNLASRIRNEFGSFERFKTEFSQAAGSVEGSGWAALSECKRTKRLIIMQIEKHNLNIYPGFNIILVLDVWEHAFYLDYENNKSQFIDAFWNIINWDEVSKRLK